MVTKGRGKMRKETIRGRVVIFDGELKSPFETHPAN
jgi:hypothetical protein